MAATAILRSPAVTRVRLALESAGLDPEIVELPGAAYTAKAAAAFLGCDVGQIANSLVFRAVESGRAVLVMSSGARRVDTARLAQVVGEPIGKADADFVRNATGFAIGGVAPAGHTGEIVAYVERSLAAYPKLWAAAGHPNTVFPLTYAELLRLCGGREADVAAPSP
ncbi:MAG TPA: YbaK/EbsC family protein [Usitatibacter sp.]|nr:YbaK/EbsC family protein [Usitatibacter sp.]